MAIPDSISIELEVEGDSRSLFVLKIDGVVFAEHLTAAQTHSLVGDFLERIALPGAREKPDVVRRRKLEMLPARISRLREVRQRG
jgi:hypothetical protein